MTLASEEPPEVASPEPTGGEEVVEETPPRRNLAQALQIIIAGVILLGSIIWFILDPGFEQLLAAAGAVATLAADIKSNAWVKWVVYAGLLLFAAGAVYLGISEWLNREPTALTVRVTDAEGHAIPSAQVRLFHGADYTSKATTADGTAVLLVDPKASRGKLIVESLEYIVQEQDVGLIKDETVHVVLQREDGTEHIAIVRVRDATKGRTVPNAQVEVIQGGEVFSGVSDDSGLARFLLDFPDETLTVDLTVRYGGAEASSSVTLRRNAVQDVQVETETENIEASPIQLDQASAEDRSYEGPRPLGYDILTSGAFASSTEFHLYYLNVDAGDTVIAEAEPGDGTCVALELLDPESIRLTETRDRSGAWNAELRAAVTETGRHTLVAKACGQASGGYTLFVTRVPAAP